MSDACPRCGVWGCSPRCVADYPIQPCCGTAHPDTTDCQGNTLGNPYESEPT